jgi:hypothetical protein
MDECLDTWLGKNNYDVWCISLKRSVKRRHNFSKWANEIGLTFQFWDAMDYSKVTPEEYMKYCNVHIGGRPISGASALRVSLTLLLQQYLQETSKPFLLVFEDDAGFVAEGTKSGSSHSVLSCKETMIEFIHQCRNYGNTHPDAWEQVWFGYYDDDVGKRTYVDKENYPLVCLSLGTSMTHAMLFRRSAVVELLSLLQHDVYKHLPIDEFTKFMMQKNGKTLIPPSTIVCQTDDERCINYDE